MNAKELQVLVEAQAAQIAALTARIEALEAAKSAAKPAPKANKPAFVRQQDPAAAARKAEYAKFAEFAREYARANGGCTAEQAEQAYKAAQQAA